LCVSDKGVYAVDQDGDIVWHYDDHEICNGLCVSPNGHNVLYVYGPEWRGNPSGILELDVFGAVVKEWAIEDTYKHFGFPLPEDAVVVRGLGSLHHAISVTTAGNILAIAFDDRLVSNFETQCPGGINTTAPLVRGDVIVEIDYVTGEVLQSFSTFDFLDICDFNLGFRSPQDRDDFSEWTHLNWVSYDPTNHQILFSLLSYGWVGSLYFEETQRIKKATRSNSMSKSGDLLWLLGNDRDSSFFRRAPHFLFPGASPVLFVCGKGWGGVGVGVNMPVLACTIVAQFLIYSFAAWPTVPHQMPSCLVSRMTWDLLHHSCTDGSFQETQHTPGMTPSGERPLVCVCVHAVVNGCYNGIPQTCETVPPCHF
jgi:hypothetical protein